MTAETITRMYETVDMTVFDTLTGRTVALIPEFFRIGRIVCSARCYSARVDLHANTLTKFTWQSKTGLVTTVVSELLYSIKY